MDSGKLLLANYLLVGVTAGLFLATVVYALATWRMNKATRRQAALLNIEMYFSLLTQQGISYGFNEETKQFYWFSVSRFGKLLKDASGSSDPWLYSHAFRAENADELDKGDISIDTKNSFELVDIPLSNSAIVLQKKPGTTWMIQDGPKKYLVLLQHLTGRGKVINVYRRWSDYRSDLEEMDIPKG